MNAFRHVLFPVDFSPRCEAAIPFVKEMVCRCRAKLTLLHVVEIPVDWYAAVTPSLHMPWDEFETKYRLGRECLTGFATRQFADVAKEVNLNLVCERGDPGYAIVAQSVSTGADLIMIPTHGKGAFRSLFLGSVASRVLHNAECAVWTDAHLETGLSPEYLHIAKILCAVDRTEGAVCLVRGAVELAQDYGADVELIYANEAAVPGTDNRFSLEFDQGFDQFLGAAGADAMAEIHIDAAQRLKVHVGAGSVRDVIRDAATHFGADLMMIGRGHLHRPLSRLRSHAYSIIQDSPCPVLSC